MSNKKVVVVGAGMIGLCSAYYLNKKGFQVTVLDNGDGTDNCSYGNAGYFCPSHVIPLASPGIISQGLKWMLDSQGPFYIKPRLNKDLLSWILQFKKAATKKRVAKAAPLLHELCMKSKSLIEAILDQENIESAYKKSGLLMLCKTERELQHEIAAAQLASSFGQQASEISVAEAEKLNPGLEMNIAGAVYFRNDACFTPHLFMNSLKQVLLTKGVTIRFNQQVESFNVNDKKITQVNLKNSQVEGDEFVIATGSWTSSLVKGLKLKVPMQGGKGYSFDIANPPIIPKTPAILTEGKVAMTPMANVTRFAGTMEINGLNRDINSNRVEGIKNSIMEFFPQFEAHHFSNIKPWVGLRPCSPDGLPYVGKSNKFKNLTLATGHAMLGITMGPVTGQLVSNIISGDKISRDISLLDVDRYS